MTALALSKVVGPNTASCHHWSGCLWMWCSRTAASTYPRRPSAAPEGHRRHEPRAVMVYHLDMKEAGILPVQSPVGMQLGRPQATHSAKLKGVHNAFTMGIIGDGTSAEGDLHDTMNAVSVWSLPTIVCVTDTLVPSAPRLKKAGASRASPSTPRALVCVLACDGNDFWDVFQTTLSVRAT